MLDGTAASADLVRSLAQQHTARCIERLAEIADGPDPMAAAVACDLLLARAYGQPKQFIALGMPNLTMVLRTPDEHDTARTNGEATRAWDA